MGNRIADMISTGVNVQIVVSVAELKEFGLSLISEALGSKSQQQQEDKLLTPEEAAKKVKSTKSTLWRWGKLGYLTPRRIGGKVFYKESDLNKLMEA
ncbi:MAG: helix-turn-helix domain-containing protein [Phocaeicola sp.]